MNNNYNLDESESIVIEQLVKYENKETKMVLTNKNILFLQKKGLFRKKYKTVKSIPLNKIKVIDDEVQIKQRMSTLQIQTTIGTIVFKLNNIFEAKKVKDKIINLKMHTNLLDRTKKNVLKAKNTSKEVLDIIEIFLGIGLIFKKAYDHKDEIMDLLKIKK